MIGIFCATCTATGYPCLTYGFFWKNQNNLLFSVGDGT